MAICLTRASALAALLTLSTLGCGSGGEPKSETVPVKGKVSYNGQRVPKGTITFQSDSGQPATGEIQPDGTFSLGTFVPGDGTVPGHQKMMIIADTSDPTKIPGSSPGYVAPKDLVPTKPNTFDTSGQEATVSKDKPSYDFNLK